MKALLFALGLAFGVAANATTLAISPPSIERGTSVTVNWSGIPSPTSTDWIGLYTPGTSNGSYHRFQYTNGAASGSASFLVPATIPPGTYQLRIFTANSYTLLASSSNFTLTVPNITLSASTANTSRGATVNVTWGGNPGPTTLDWIGLYTPGYSNSPTYYWTYVPQSASGSVPFTIPAGLAFGTYQFRLYYNDGYSRLATTNDFTVGPTVTGTITSAGSPLGGVTLATSNGGTCSPSNASGQYSCAVPSGWSGTVTPSQAGHTFSPPSRSFTNVVSNQAAQTFSATSNVASLYFIHVDHLNTPRLVANAAGQTVWRWDQQEPFGNNVPDENPSGLGVFDLPLGLPGQYFDKETNLHYNYYRDYDPSLGIYKQSDLIGLRGGLNTYVYGRGNPLLFIDPLGLNPAGSSGSSCVAACTLVGGVLGGIGGQIGGGTIGGIVGAGGGTVVAPGPGTVVGGASGAVVGSLVGRPVGIAIGGAIGNALGQAMCPDDNAEKCEKKREMEEGLCEALAMQWGRQGIAVCKRSAMTRYGECLRFGPGGVTTPLHGVDTPL